MFADIVLSFPANSRYGYGGNCLSCHHSPTGGGSLTSYGRSTSAEISFFEIFETEDGREESFPVIFGFDSRFLYINTPKREAFFPMQTDAELGLGFKGFKAIGQIGLYGADYSIQSYRAYMMYTIKKHSFRIGQFAPAFGINEPDHLLPGRNLIGFDARKGSLNLEYTFSSKDISTHLTLIAGCQGPLYSELSVLCDNVGEFGATLVLSYFPKPFITTWLSLGYFNSWQNPGYGRPLGAISALVGNKDFYNQFELALNLDLETFETKYQGYNKIMFIPFIGVHLGYIFKTTSDSYSYGSLLQLYPLAGIELQASLERSISDFDDQTTFLTVLHFYF